MVKWERQAYYLTKCISSQTVLKGVAGEGTKTCRNIDEAVINSVCKNQRKFLTLIKSSRPVLTNRTLCSDKNVLYLCCPR